MQKPTIQKLVSAVLSAFLPCHFALADDSGALTLGSTIGATDYYKVNCPDPATDRLLFSVKDNSLDDISDIPPQKVNAHIFKNGVEIGVLSAQSNTSTDWLALTYGDGKYSIVVDTIGTNDALQTPQYFTFDYQCLNSNDAPTKASGFKIGNRLKIKNFKTAKATINCKPNKSISPQTTTYLKLKLTNLSAVPIAEWVSSIPVLNAQVAKKDKNLILNTSDLAGDANSSNPINLQAGAGNYFIAVNNTGTSNSPNNSKDYSFVYSCLGSDNSTKTANFNVIQDQ